MKCIFGRDLICLRVDIWLASFWIDWRLARFGIDQRLIRIKYLHDLERIDVNVKRVRNWRRVRGVHYLPFLYFVEQHDRPNFTIEFLAVNRLLRGVWRSAWRARGKQERLCTGHLVLADVFKERREGWSVGNEAPGI